MEVGDVAAATVITVLDDVAWGYYLWGCVCVRVCVCVCEKWVKRKGGDATDGGEEKEGGRKWQKGMDALVIVGSCSAVACHYRGRSCRPLQNTGAPWERGDKQERWQNRKWDLNQGLLSASQILLPTEFYWSQGLQRSRPRVDGCTLSTCPLLWCKNSRGLS